MNENNEIQQEITSNELDSILDNNESKKMKIAFKIYTQNHFQFECQESC